MVSGASPVVEHAGDYAVVSLSGDVDIAVKSQILDAYQQAIDLMNVPHLIVDVSGVTFMDSTGVSTLAAALEKVKAHGGAVFVVGASARILRLFHIVRLDAVIPVLPETRYFLGGAAARPRELTLHS